MSKGRKGTALTELLSGTQWLGKHRGRRQPVFPASSPPTCLPHQLQRAFAGAHS